MKNNPYLRGFARGVAARSLPLGFVVQTLPPTPKTLLFLEEPLPQPILLHGDVSLDGLPFPAMPYVGIPTDCAGGIGLLAKPDYC